MAKETFDRSKPHVNVGTYYHDIHDTAGSLTIAGSGSTTEGNPPESVFLTFAAPASSTPESAAVAYPFFDNEFEFDPTAKGLVESLDFQLDVLPSTIDGPGQIHVTLALYQAARAGVKVDLIVRDTCRLRPGIPGLSENVRVISVVGRFLEHTRIFHFGNGGQPEYYLGSADCMKRNLESRVEVVFPIEDPRLHEELRFILDAQLADNRSAWDMQADGTYLQRVPGRDKKERSSQYALVERADKRLRVASKLRKRPIRGIARRAIR